MGELCHFYSKRNLVVLPQIFIKEPIKNVVRSKKGQGAPASRKADEVRLDALQGGLTTKTGYTARFCSHKVFRGDLNRSMLFGSGNCYIRFFGMSIRAAGQSG